MKKRCIALLLAVLLVPVAAWAQAPADGPVDGQEIALRLLDSVFATEDAGEQMRLLLQAAEAAPENPDILVSCAQLLFYLDSTGEHSKQCEEWLRKAMSLTKGSDRQTVARMLAEQLVYMGQTAEARTLLEDILEEAPHNNTIKRTLATTLFYEGESEEALVLLEALLEDSPQDLEARRLRAAILLDLCRWDEALVAYQRISEEWPEYLDGLYGQYLTYVASGQFEMGVRAIDILLGAGGEDQLWLDRARLRLWKQYDPEKALTEAIALQRAEPGWVDAATVEMVSLVMLERYDEALAVVDRIAELDEGHSRLLRAIVQMNAGEWHAAQDTLEALLGLLPNSYIAKKNISTVYLEGYDDADGAMAAMAGAFALTGGTGDMDMYLQLGHVYHRQGNLLEAARAFSAADTATYDDPSPLYCLAMVCIDAGREQNALEIITEMERRYPGWYETIMARVLVEDARGNPEEALAAYELVIEKFPFLASGMVHLECILRTAAGDAEGLKMLEDLLDEGDATDWDAYAYALLLTDALDAAADALAEAEKHLPEPNEDNAGERRNMLLSIATTRAELRLAQGDYEGSIEAFAEAASYGWHAYTLSIHPKYETLRETEGYAALMQDFPPLDRAWDLTIMPTIPQQTEETP